MNVDLASNSIVNSSLSDLLIVRSSLFLIIGVIQTNLSVLNGTALDSLVSNSLRTENQVRLLNTVINKSMFSLKSLQVQNSLLRTTLLLPRSLAVQDHVLNVHNAMQEVFVDTGNVNAFILSIKNVVVTQVDYAVDLRINISSLTSHTLANLSSTLYQDTNSCLFRAQTSVESLSKLLVGQQNRTIILRMKYSALNTSNLLLNLNRISYMVDNLDFLCESISNSGSRLSSDTRLIINLVSSANSSLSMSDINVARAQILLFLARGDIQALTQIIGDDFTGSGNSGSGDIVSGSGVGQNEPVIVLPVNITSIGNGISDLRYVLEQLTRLKMYYGGMVNDAADTSLLFSAANLFNE